ncbi:OmpH family outer membrane protein [Vibrio sp. SS-MA-C1-2]|uniref:OmpH family outer membrane protein n=1 Tax=Vibrio sp. SS-MA-C1-2 TaxID=2908646 RepID=UPI001F3A3E08|nr:OmpH family outer membrane protein [Vibrio sp. SS-MA-C1-2]UJF18894.1 OmpH family outer membrane protein [Vibrio sp. SS-MA-C1-2]
MNKFLKAASVGLIILSASAYANAAEAAQKVGYVNIQAVFQQLPQREAVSKKLRAEFKDRIDELKRMETDIKGKVDKLKRDGQLMSATDRTNAQRAIVSLESDYKLKAKALDEDNRRRQNEERQKLLMEIQTAVGKVAQQDGYDLVVDAQTVLYAKPADDLSKKVIEEVK